jgi:HlyD family secretion protein
MAVVNNNASFYSRHRLLVWVGGTILGVVLLASFMSRDDVVPVRAAKVERGMLRSVVSTNGKVEPIHDFEAHAPVGTTVVKTLVKEGDHVKKGQLLVQLDDSQARSDAARALAQVRAADASLHAVESGGTREEVLTTQSELVKARTARDGARRNLEALQRLQQTGAASPGEVQEAKNQLARSEADLKLLEQKQTDRYSRPEVAQVEAQKQEALAAYDAAQDILRQMNVRAPFDGVVYALPVRQGMYTNAGSRSHQDSGSCLCGRA